MKTVKKFNMDAWWLGQDIDDLYTFTLTEFSGNIEKQCEAMVTLLEKRFETCVKKGISMALEFITENDDYCFSLMSTKKGEWNPKGEPVIVTLFGDDDYFVTRPLSAFLEMCSDDDLDVIEKGIIHEKNREHRFVTTMQQAKNCRSNKSPCNRRRRSSDNTCMHYPDPENITVED